LDLKGRKKDRVENCIMMNFTACSSANNVRVIKSRRMRWAGHVTRMEEGRDVYKNFVGRPEENRPLGRLGRRWEDNIKMDLKETGPMGRTGFGWLKIGSSGELL
jgi:hypothetical protein